MTVVTFWGGVLREGHAISLKHCISGARILCHILGVPDPSVGHVPLRYCCARGWRSRDCGYILGGVLREGHAISLKH